MSEQTYRVDVSERNLRVRVTLVDFVFVRRSLWWSWAVSFGEPPQSHPQFSHLSILCWINHTIVTPVHSKSSSNLSTFDDRDGKWKLIDSILTIYILEETVQTLKIFQRKFLLVASEDVAFILLGFMRRCYRTDAKKTLEENFVRFTWLRVLSKEHANSTFFLGKNQSDRLSTWISLRDVDGLTCKMEYVVEFDGRHNSASQQRSLNKMKSTTERLCLEFNIRADSERKCSTDW